MNKDTFYFALICDSSGGSTSVFSFPFFFYCRFSIHRDLVNVQVEMLRQFQIQQVQHWHVSTRVCECFDIWKSHSSMALVSCAAAREPRSRDLGPPTWGSLGAQRLAAGSRGPAWSGPTSFPGSFISGAGSWKSLGTKLGPDQIILRSDAMVTFSWVRCRLWTRKT